MGENLTFAKEVLQRTMELLRSAPSGAIPDEDMRDIQYRIQIAQNALIQNERKIWLRTKEGKEMVGDFGVASTKLLGAIERLIKSEVEGTSLIKDLKAALGEVELHAKRLNEETRKRSMVVT